MKGAQRFVSWPARLLLGFLVGVNVPIFGALPFADPPAPLPTWFKVLAGLFACGLAVVTVRLLTMAVIVTADEQVIVRSIFRTTRVPAHAVVAVASPDWDPVAAIPRLLVDDGASVRLTPILRMKNRAWGVDKTAHRNMDGVADRLGVPVQRGERSFPIG